MADTNSLKRWQLLVEEAKESASQSVCPPYYTGLEYSDFFSAAHNTHLYLKHEHMQHTGSFKYRGALNKILSLSEKERCSGIITASSGNHGMACAFAAKQLNIDATVYVPQTASGLKVSQISRLGADVVTIDGECLEAERAAQQAAKDAKKVYISPYNDEAIIAGQGTIGIELLEQLPNIDAVFIAVGGGGLIGGIGAYLKSIHPHIEVIGCWPEAAPAMAKCLNAGAIINVEEFYTYSDGTAGNVEPDAITFPLCQQVIDKQVLVSEKQIAQVIKQMAQHERQIIEGAAAVAIAGALKLSVDYTHKHIGVVVCGRNIAFEKLTEVLR